MTEDRILRRREVEKMTGISRSRIYVFMNREEDPFPRPILLGENMVGWRLSEVQAWLDGRQRAEPYSARGKFKRNIPA